MSKDLFNRSEYMKERHRIAKKQKAYFESRFDGERGFKYRDFFRKNSPIQQNIVAYEVSYQVSYRGTKDSIIITPRTFIVVGFKGQESEIQNRTMSMILDSKGELTESHLQVNSINAIKNSTDIKIMPRGMEESQKKPSIYDIDNLIDKQFLVKDLDTKIKMKNKKGREGTLELDIRHFI